MMTVFKKEPPHQTSSGSDPEGVGTQAVRRKSRMYEAESKWNQLGSKPSVQFLADLKLEHIKNPKDVLPKPVLP